MQPADDHMYGSDAGLVCAVSFHLARPAFGLAAGQPVLEGIVCGDWQSATLKRIQSARATGLSRYDLEVVNGAGGRSQTSWSCI